MANPRILRRQFTLKPALGTWGGQFFFKPVGQIMALRTPGRPSGWEDGRTKKWDLPKQTRNLFLTSSRFSGLWRCGFRCRLRCQFGLLLRGKLMLDLEADCVQCGGGVAEYLRGGLAGARGGASFSCPCFCCYCCTSGNQGGALRGRNGTAEEGGGGLQSRPQTGRILPPDKNGIS